MCARTERSVYVHSMREQVDQAVLRHPTQRGLLLAGCAGCAAAMAIAALAIAAQLAGVVKLCGTGLHKDPAHC